MYDQNMFNREPGYHDTFNPDFDPFPLECWCDLSQPIADTDRQRVEDQMTLRAARLGDPMHTPRTRWSIRRLKLAVQAHNARFPRSP
jgi:hypothetical protein